MNITITIEDGGASAIVQNIALSQGWTTKDDEQARVLTGQLLVKQINDLAVAGEAIRVRNEQQAAIKEKLASFVSAE